MAQAFPLYHAQDLGVSQTLYALFVGFSSTPCGFRKGWEGRQ